MSFSKQIFCVLISLFLGTQISAKSVFAGDSSYTDVEYTFMVNNGTDSLKATLSIPDNYDLGKLVILTAPPTSSDRNYFGLFTSLSHIMCKSGIAVLRFDNRAFSYPNKYPPGDLSMFDQADDISYAISSLKNDKRFFATQIGLLGHSEGATSVAIAASRKIDLNFVIMLSPMGIPGKELSTYQFTNALIKRVPFIDTLTKSRLVADNKWKLDLMTGYTNKEDMRRALVTHIDSIFKSQDVKWWFGQRTFNDVVNSEVPFWITNHRISYSKFDPEPYYSKIVCPALIIFGTADYKIDYRTNSANILRIFKKAKKNNFDLIISKNTNHNYTLNSGIQNEEKTVTDFETSLFYKISKWITKI